MPVRRRLSVNLKDRQNKEAQKPGNSTDITQKSNPRSAEQTLLSKVTELSAALTATTDALEKEKQRSRTLDRTISKLSSRNSTLTSKTQEQLSLIAALRTEISEAQDINRSLLKDNQALMQENENIRYDHGVESRREVDDLKIEISHLYSKIDDLNKQVDQSCVAAVREAYDELERFRRKADRQMDSYQAFVADKLRGILDEKNRHISALNHKIKALEGGLWLARDLLLVYALCSLAAAPVILLDLQKLLINIDLLLEEYYEWICYPCYFPHTSAEPLPYESGTAWTVRIVSVLAGLAFTVGMICFCRHVFTRIRTQWCRFATRITVSLLIIVSALGTVIKKYLQWNTAALFFAMFIIVIKLLHRLEISYTRAYKTDEWEHIKNHNDKSYYAAYYICRLLTHKRGQK